MGTAAEAGMEEIDELNSLYFGEYFFTARLDRQPDGEPIGQAFERWIQTACIS